MSMVIQNQIGVVQVGCPEETLWWNQDTSLINQDIFSTSQYRIIIVEKFGTSNYSTLIKWNFEIISKLNQNYGKVETNNKVPQSPAPWKKKKALHFLGKSKLEIIKKSAEFLDNIR